jgi:hypothetical protein
VIFGKAPAGTDWTSENVYAYQDNNNDVGGTTPMRLDAPNSNWDGYETLVFDRGYGPDPDAAWIRRDPNNSNQIQLAFKFSLIDNDSYFMWGVWSWEGAPDPAVFDYHDHFTSAQAGSPVSDSSDYPLKEVAAMDNSCRWAYGFEPTGAELGVCYVQPTPTPTPKPGSISGGVFHDYDLSGSRDGGEPGLGGFTIKLGAGACGSTGYASTDTAGNGSYSFNNIPAGTYCVSVVNPGGGCSGWTLSTATQFTVHLDPGENLAVTWFGFYAPIC